MILQLGIDPIHFGIVLVVTNNVAMLTPPLGVNLFVASRIAGISVERISVAVIPYLIALTLCILLFNYQASRSILTIFFSFFKLYTSLCSHSSGIIQNFTNKFRHNCHLLAFTDRYSN